MKVEMRCRSCGSDFLVDAGAAEGTPCPLCAGELEPAKGAAPMAAGGGAAAPGSGTEVVCPRCRLHFSLRPEFTAEAAVGHKTVLVVEEDEYFLTVAREALEPRFAVKAARTAVEARRTLEAGGIDLMLLDLGLEEGRAGLGLLESLRRKPCPILLLLTAEDESAVYGDLWDRLRALGADDVVIKGMQSGEMLARKAGSLLGEPDDVESTLP